MKKLEHGIHEGSGNDGKGYLLGTFFRDFYEEKRLTESETDERTKSGKAENNYLLDDVTIFDMLLGKGDVTVRYLPDRIEVRSPEPPAIC